MPKPTFFNLKEEKRRTLIAAAKSEFSRVSLYEASIANILNEAGIPRGSFYQYFEDKEDAFYYLLNEHAKERYEHFIAHLKHHDGDLFKAMADMFQSVLEYSHDRGQSNFIRNVVLNMNYKIENTFTRFLSEGTFSNHYDDLFQLVDIEHLNISDQDALYHVLQIVTAVMFHNLVHSLSKELTIEEAMKKYRVELDLLKTGLAKSST
ncbi:TetR/AcrR family transcriptional regulator [Thalassobacillus sp. CUG 92003]|uniref:TetR/AcrR family transcriptional regulator n=1 Tax=Thalassobacillus sp. CUG 92003 TaxID=2736641 RepID=UPI0015E74C9E|nr:TetR/AcrR family transcriptional regulator [Thalassobacillus sp. CUG 92003]